jgi:serine/threonine protein kinase
MLPETIGRYKIKDVLGRGQATVVYRALDTQANREVVIKVFALEPTGDAARDLSLKAHFRRELKMIASLEHTAIVPVYDVGEQNGQPYFVMRYMAGGSLNQLITDEGRLSLQETAQIVNRIAPALDSAHKKNIIHRDIKPDNILFDGDEHPYISDFGVAKPDKTNDPDTEGVVGTPGYMSPEQTSAGDVDERSDVYSLGVVICQMLSGRPPFRKEPSTSSARNKNPEYSLPNILSEVPELPPEMEEFVNIALANNKQDRYVTVMHLARALNRIAFGEDLTSPLRERQNRSAVRTSVVWILGSIAFLVAFFWIFASWGNIPFFAISSPPTVTLIPSETAVPPTETFTPLPASATAALVPTPTLEPAPVNVFPGGADQIALLSGNELYLMNTDGSELTQVRTENSPKSNLQWIPGNRLIYLSRNCVYMLEAKTKQTQQLFCFTANEQFEGFSVSPDGKLAAISVQRTLNVFPFDIDTLKTVNTRFNLLENKDNCFYNQYPFLEAFWSQDMSQLVAHVIDTRLTNSDQLFLFSIDIENCDNVGLTRLDTIPGGRIDFDTDSSKRLGGFDWDGKNLFLLNDSIRNDGFGNLYLYNSDTKDSIEINPIDGQCCYRDARWSPDGTYILFAFQRFDLGSIELYYIPFADLESGGEAEPINLPNGFFSTARDKPRPALHPSP